jgi:hypothetical protein
LAKSASVRLLTDIHARPNKTGEYQSPPSAKAETAAAKTASQLRCGIEMFSLQKLSLRKDELHKKGLYCKKFP